MIKPANKIQMIKIANMYGFKWKVIFRCFFTQKKTLRKYMVKKIKDIMN